MEEIREKALVDPYGVGRTSGRLPGYRERQKGVKPGTYQVECDACKGFGLIWGNVPPGKETPEPINCDKCEGRGTIAVNGERRDDHLLRTQPSWRAVLTFSLLAAAAAAGLCWLIVDRASAW